MKITEIRVHTHNSEGNQVMEVAKMEGDFNLVNPCFEAYKKKLDRAKISYIFKVEYAPSNFYAYNLTNSEFESYIKYIPNLGKTW